MGKDECLKCQKIKFSYHLLMNITFMNLHRQFIKSAASPWVLRSF